MGVSSSKTKTKAEPYAAAVPAINAGITASSDVFQQQQPVLQGLGATALAGYNSIAPQAYSPSAFVKNAQATAAGIAAGSNDNPGASTYSSIMAGQNPALSSFYALQGGGTNGARSGYADLATNGGGITAPSVSASTIGAAGVSARDVAAPTGSAATQQFYADTLGGKYLTANPYIDGIAQRSGEAATKAANQRFGASGLGAGMSTAYSDVVSRNVADAENAVRYSNYNDERSRQLTAAGQSDALYNADQNRILTTATGNADRDLSAQSTNAGNRLTADQANQNAGLAASRDNASNSLTAQNSNLGARLSGLAGVSGADQQQFSNQLGAATGLGSAYAQDASTRLGAATAADAAYNAQMQQRLQALSMTGGLEDANYAGINPALNLLTASANIPYTGVAALGSSLSTLAGQYGVKTGTSTPSLAQQAGQAAQIASLFSDRRLKTNIEHVGSMADGLGVYEFDYIWGGTRQRGVMADEVERLRPWALGSPVNGFATVNYGAL